MCKIVKRRPLPRKLKYAGGGLTNEEFWIVAKVDFPVFLEYLRALIDSQAHASYP